MLSGILLGVAALWLLYAAYALIRVSLRGHVPQGWSVSEGYRARLVVTRGDARAVLIGGLRPRAVLYVNGRRQGRRPLDELDLDGWVQSAKPD